MQIKCPPISDALLVYLNSVFPDVTVDPSKTDPAEAYGTVRVIRHLKAVQQQQESDFDVS